MTGGCRKFFINLRLSKTDPVNVPVQRQFSDDLQFISHSLKQQEEWVLVSDSNSSASDLNYSDLVQSDGETNIANDKTVANSDSVVSDNPSTTVTQEMINAQILAQLQSIGIRSRVLSARKVPIQQKWKVLQRRWLN